MADNAKHKKRPPTMPPELPSQADRVKRPRLSPPVAHSSRALPGAQQPVLACYYSRVATLRTYILELFPKASKSRRHKIALIGTETSSKSRVNEPSSIASQPSVFRVSLGGRGGVDGTRIHDLAHLLDSTLVGVVKPLTSALSHRRQRDLAAFTQSQYGSSLCGTDTGPTSSMAELVDFTIHSLFNGPQDTSYFVPPHILCQGFCKTTPYGAPNLDYDTVGGIPGLVCRYPNKNVAMLKNYPWVDVLALLGNNCEDIMLHLLMDCGLFIQLDPQKNTFYQLSGIPLSELNPIQQAKRSGAVGQGKESPPEKKGANQTPGNVVFVRRRILYAPPMIKKGHPKYPDSSDLCHTVHLMQDIFPRQFNLDNVFQSSDGSYTSKAPKDYTVRQDTRSANNLSAHSKIPKRLRGQLVVLIQDLQKRHSRCAYVELLRHYCPIQKSGPVVPQANLTIEPPPQPINEPDINAIDGLSNPPERPAPKMTDYATPMSSVSAFCRAVLSNLIPNEMYGSGNEGIQNRDIVLRYVDKFICLRRFESLTLHEVSQCIKVTCVRWLQPPAASVAKGNNPSLSQSDFRKRTEIFLEFIYYIFDSLVIPLVRSNFYVTESNVYRNRLFYFRQDVWKKITEPSLYHLKGSIFQRVKRTTCRTLSDLSLGYSHLRLLPKSTGARPIVNLRRKPTVPTADLGKKGSALSINAQLLPMFHVLGYEKTRDPTQMGSSLESVAGIYPRLKKFRQIQMQNVSSLQDIGPFYFVKLDVHSCFDTIPQKRLISFIEKILSDTRYRVSKHVEFRLPPGSHSNNIHHIKANPTRKFISRATAFEDLTSTYDTISKLSSNVKNHSVFVGTGARKLHERNSLLDLLEKHVRNNLVKIGSDYYRQRNGIPQGSVVSSLLCSLFYGEHERDRLGFLQTRDGVQQEESILLRLVDDYLLITLRKEVAVRFLQVMLDGDIEYGISVRPDKTLVNFDVCVNGVDVPRLHNSLFPYCGTLINTKTLAIIKDRSRGQTADDWLHIHDSLTVDLRKQPGDAFLRKAISSFKMQINSMFLDIDHNSPTIVLANLYDSLVESAMKIYTYWRALLHRQPWRHQKTSKRPSSDSKLLICAIKLVIEFAVRSVRSPVRSPAGSESLDCVKIPGDQIRWLGAIAFMFVFGQKQTQLHDVLDWLSDIARKSKPSNDREFVKLWKIVKESKRKFEKYRF
ncbi:hypothetical protein FQN57_004666 [Myotisia sp. PD_48]|nr:hypothetical protein FQN57_004666 [Myotisia sp. PD_48]